MRALVLGLMAVGLLALGGAPARAQGFVGPGSTSACYPGGCFPPTPCYPGGYCPPVGYSGYGTCYPGTGWCYGKGYGYGCYRPYSYGYSGNRFSGFGFGGHRR